ncbi:hypothetical protein [Cellulomonas telluris]|uniref:hypothetical protein n=1 Tax=Cellulomonas telluris TaxID=2306636 RepID=UPI00145629DF|nr:hypothetical protein [Cellulomonas telluris]
MTTTHAPTSPATARHSRALTFTLHLAGMAVAMVLGMLLLLPVVTAAGAALGWDASTAGPEVTALAMAVTMTLGMAVWMVHRGHGPRPVAEMGAAMALPFVVGLVPYWAGAVGAGDALLLGHVLMLPAMVGVMLLRRDEYAHAHAHAPSGPRSGWWRAVEAVSHRWPTLLALGLTFDGWLNPGIPSPWLLVALGGEYLVIGAARRQFRRDALLAAHVAGLLLYLGLAAVAASAPAEVAAWVVAAGWLLHVGWDVALHRADRVVWRWYAEACIVIDLVVGATVLLTL